MRAKVFGLIFLAAGAAALGYPRTSEPKSVDGTVRLGVLAPLSGDYANYGRYIRDGAELAAAELAKLGVSARVIYEDACLPAEAVRAAGKLLYKDRVQAVAANYCLVALGAVRPLLERAAVPIFETDVVPNQFLGAGGFVLTTNTAAAPEAMRAAEYGRTELKAERAAILYLTTQWGEAFQEAFKAKFEALGGTIIAAESRPIGENDFRTELARIKTKRPDVLFVALVGPGLGNALRQARELNLAVPVLSADSIEEQSVIDAANGAGEGVRYFSPEPRFASDSAVKFQERFKTAYGYQPPFLSANAYDAVVLSAYALKSCGGSSSCARDSIKKTKEYEGASGRFSLNAEGWAEREFTLKRVERGRFVKAE